MGTHERVIFSHAHRVRAARKAHANNHIGYGLASLVAISLLFALGYASAMMQSERTGSDPSRLLLVAYWAEKTESPLLANYLGQLNSSLESRASQLSQDIANLQFSQSEEE